MKFIYIYKIKFLYINNHIYINNNFKKLIISIKVFSI